MRAMRNTLLFISLFASLVACQSTLRNTVLLTAAEPNHPDLLRAAVDNYFLAETPDEMRKAVTDAKAAGPFSGDYHFIAADLAMFENRIGDRFDHLVAAVRDTQTQFFRLAIQYLWYMAWDFGQLQTAEALFKNVASNHPDPRMRTFAAYGLSHFLVPKGDIREAAEMADSIGWRLPFAIIGTWNNEQGKGFDMVLPPEEEVDLDKRYIGHFVEIGWRPDPIFTPTNELDLTELFHPYSWAIGYAVCSFEAQNEQAVELRLGTSDALKVWVNEQLVFADRVIEGGSFDTVVIPTTVNRGTNRILIKMSQDGDATWDLYGRLTGPGGAPLKPNAFVKVPADRPITTRNENTHPLLDARGVIEKHIEHQKNSPIVHAFARSRWTEIMGLSSIPVQAAESYAEAAPKSLRAKYSLAIALWNNQERAKANLLLTDLFNKHGAEFLEIALKQARFWDQNELDNQARNLLVKLVEKVPESVSAKLALANWYAKKKWEEDRLFVLKDAYRRWPDDPTVIRELAACYQELDFDGKSLALHDRILDVQPYNWTSLMVKFDYANAALDYKTAEKAVRKLLKAWPDDVSLLAKLAETKRRQEQFDEASQIVSRIRDARPDSPWAYNRLAHFAYYHNKTGSAVKLWKQGLARNPDDGDLEERLGYLSPAKPEPWRVDVPTREQIMNAIGARTAHEAHPGANTILLLDDTVMKLNTDGSSVGVISSVMYALNIDGRDAITTHRIGCPGRTKVLSAFSVSPNEQITEASSIDGNEIKFRGLEVGSTIAVQSRCENPPNALIGNYFAMNWAFQGFRTQFIDSRYTLYAAPEEDIKEFVWGEIQREETIEGDLKRISWSAMNPPVLMPEPHMPPAQDIIWRLKLTTVPDWAEFFNWEEALLVDAFRQSPEILEVAEKLFAGAATKVEKIRRIQAYLAEDIRYKQEYENPIAGVKPHPSPMVLSRGYGDCKDKSVFFITLAKIADIEARFALLRTRGAGQVIRETPSQQFNHAIVYIPKQDGVPERRFYDPTADGLDVDILRADVPGVSAMVLDLDNRRFEWIDIPFHAPDEVYFHRDVEIHLERDGGAFGTIKMDTQGHSAAQVRLISRNDERFQKVLEVLANGVFPGATLEDYDALEIQGVKRPVQFEIGARTKTFARVDGKELSFKIPFTGDPSKSFVIENRTYPLILGTPSKADWRISFHLPAKSKIVKTPKPYKMETDCIVYERNINRKRKKILVDQQIQFMCERIPTEAYPLHRIEMQKLRQVLEDDIIIRLK